MGTQWARKEAHTNELAAAVETALQWAKERRQAVLWGGLGAAAVLLISMASVNKYLSARDMAWSKLAIAQSYAYSGQTSMGLEQLNSLAREQPGLPAAGYGLLLAGDILFQQEKFKEAQETYQRIVEQPQHKALLPLALAGMGLSQEAGGSCKEAVETDQRFLDGYQDHVMAPQVHASLARCLAKLGQTDKAKQAMERMVFLYPDTYWADWAKARTKTP